MNNKVKRKVLKALEKISFEIEKEEDLDLKTKCRSILDIAVLIKVIEDYEDLKPEIKNMLKERKQKKRMKQKEEDER